MPGHLRTPRQQFAERIKPIDKDRLKRQAINIAAIAGGLWAVLSLIATIIPSGGQIDPTPGNNSIPASTLVSGFAKEYVTTYLTAKRGEEQKLARYVTIKEGLALPPTNAQFTSVELNFLKQISADQDGLSVWTATVSGIVNGATATKPQRTFYRVTITVLNASPRAVERPMAVAAPEIGVDVRLNYRHEVRPESPLGEATTGFITAYLTGGNDFARYVTADSKDKPVRPAPYSTIEIQSIHADDKSDPTPGATVNVLATFIARTKNYSLTQLSAPVTLRAVEGRWQVVSLNSTPRINFRPESPRESTPTTTTTSTPAPPAQRR